MNNKNRFITIFMFISIIVGVLTYISIGNLIYALAISIIYIIYSLVIGGDLIKRYTIRVAKEKECYNFINNYVITLSSKNSHNEAFISATIGAKDEFEKEISHIEQLTPLEKIKYLGDYFSSNTYQMFLNIIDSYVENGGDILTMSKLLLNELTKIETNQIEFERKGKGKMFEFVILWILTFLILVLIRVSLNQFYSTMSSSLLYTIGLLVFFLFTLVSIHVAIQGYTNEKINLFKAKS